MTPIADMVAQMLAAGVPHAAIVLAVQTAEQCRSNAIPFSVAPSDSMMDRRREWDRNRKRETRHLRLPDSEWIPLVHRIVARDGHQCQYCGVHDDLTADHVEPMTRGGTHEDTNLVACCLTCNRKKSNRLLSEWLPRPPESTGQKAREIIAHKFVLSTRIHPNPPDNVVSTISILSEDKVSKKEKKESRGSRIPPEWRPTDSHFTEGYRLGFDRAQVEAFAVDMRLWAEANANRPVARKLDWNKTFSGWMRRQKPGAAAVAATTSADEQRKADYEKNGVGWRPGMPTRAELIEKHAKQNALVVGSGDEPREDLQQLHGNSNGVGPAQKLAEVFRKPGLDAVDGETDKPPH